MEHIIIYGNPSDGFHHVGPFGDGEAANTYVENTKNIRDDDWWLIKLEAPVTTQECDCSGCDLCGSHCVSDCASGDGVACLATVKVTPGE